MMEHICCPISGHGVMPSILLGSIQVKSHVTSNARGHHHIQSPLYSTQGAAHRGIPIPRQESIEVGRYMSHELGEVVMLRAARGRHLILANGSCIWTLGHAAASGRAEPS